MRWAADHALLASALIAVGTAFLGLQLPRLHLDASPRGLMAERDPSRAYYEQFKQRFGGDSSTIVLVKADDVFAAPVLSVIRQLSDAFELMERVTSVDSLTTVRNIRGEGQYLDTGPLVPAAIPGAPAALDRIRRDALGNPLLAGHLVSADGRAAVIRILAAPTPGDRDFNRRFSMRVDELIARHAAPGLALSQIGDPLIETTIGTSILGDLARLIPVSLAVMLVLLGLAFRSLLGVVLPLVTGALSIVWALGLMAILGLPVTMLTAIIPSLLLVVGSAEDVHMLAEFRAQREAGADTLTAIRTMIDHAALPLSVTTATTILGFASLVATDITMLIQFGVASALGLGANFLITVIVLPVLLTIWPGPRRWRIGALTAGPARGAIPPLMERLGALVLRRRAVIVAVALAGVIGSLVGWSTLRVDSDALSLYPERSALRQRLRELETALGGASSFSVLVETRRPDGAKDPDLLGRIDALQGFLAGTEGVARTVSLVDYLKRLHRELNGGTPAFEKVPDTAEEVAQYMLILEGRELAAYVDHEASTVRVVVRHRFTHSWELATLLERLDDYLAGRFPAGITVRYTGQDVLYRNAADSMAINEVTSIGLAFLTIALTHAALFRSLRVGFLSLIPDVIPALVTFGIMGLLGIPLNPGTAMVASIALGIAVDDTIHHVITYRRALREDGDRRLAMLRTMRAQGRPVIYVSLATAGGFFIFALSGFVPVAQFGVLAGVAMVVAMATELVLTPLVMYTAAAWVASPSAESSVVVVNGRPAPAPAPPPASGLF